MTFKLLKILILILAISQFATLEEAPEEKPEGEEGEENPEGEEETEEAAPTCNQELLNSYGLLGLPNKEEMQMDICSDVNESCCQLEDQLAIYEMLTKGDEMSLMEERFAYHEQVSLFNKRFTTT